MITEIRQIGKSTRFKIYVDGRYVLGLEGETIVKHGVKTGSDCDEDFLRTIQLESDKITAFEKAIDYLGRALKTEKQIKDYLLKKGYGEQTVLFAVQKLKGYGYIKDENYAKSFVDCYKLTKSKRMIEFELKKNGVCNNIIDECLCDFDDEQSLKTLVEKQRKKGEMDSKSKQKLIRNLLAKGYKCDEVLKAIEAKDEDWN